MLNVVLYTFLNTSSDADVRVAVVVGAALIIKV